MANANRYPVRSKSPELVILAGRILGGTTSAVSIAQDAGCGFTIAWVSTGIYTVTYPGYSSLGTYITAHAQIHATTAANKKGYTVVLGLPVAGAQTLTLTNASESLADLAAAEWIGLTAFWRATSVHG